MTGVKERRDSTDSDKENESLVESPDDSNAFIHYSHHHHQTYSNVCKDKIIFNTKTAIDSVRNTRETHAEEDLDHLLTNLFSEDDDDVEKNLESSVKSAFELPRPEEIGLASIPETSDLVLSVCTSSNDSFTTEPWSGSGKTDVDFQSSPSQDVNQLGVLPPCGEMAEDVGPTDVFLGYETSTLDEDIKTALEISASKDIDFLRDDISVDVDIGVLQEDTHQILYLHADQIEDSLARCDEIKSEILSQNKTEEEKDEAPGVRTRGGRKRMPGTVVDLLVSSYNISRRRNTRCKVSRENQWEFL